MVENYTTLCTDLLDSAGKLTETVEKEVFINKEQALEHVDCALTICNQVKGWCWSRQLDIIRKAVADDQVMLSEWEKMKSSYKPGMEAPHQRESRKRQPKRKWCHKRQRLEE